MHPLCWSSSRHLRHNVALVIDKIFKGTNPTFLVQQPTR